MTRINHGLSTYYSTIAIRLYPAVWQVRGGRALSQIVFILLGTATSVHHGPYCLQPYILHQVVSTRRAVRIGLHRPRARRQVDTDLLDNVEILVHTCVNALSISSVVRPFSVPPRPLQTLCPRSCLHPGPSVAPAATWARRPSYPPAWLAGRYARGRPSVAPRPSAAFGCSRSHGRLR